MTLPQGPESATQTGGPASRRGPKRRPCLWRRAIDRNPPAPPDGRRPVRSQEGDGGQELQRSRVLWGRCPWVSYHPAGDGGLPWVRIPSALRLTLSSPEGAGRLHAGGLCSVGLGLRGPAGVWPRLPLGPRLIQAMRRS